MLRPLTRERAAADVVAALAAALRAQVVVAGKVEAVEQAARLVLLRAL
jgi:malonyl CoA-acyl carrier protein transacylase